MVAPLNPGKPVNTPPQPEINREQAVQTIQAKLEALELEGKRLRGLLRKLGVKSAATPRKPMSAETKSKLAKGLAVWREKNEARKTAEIASLIKEAAPAAPTTKGGTNK